MVSIIGIMIFMSRAKATNQLIIHAADTDNHKKRQVGFLFYHFRYQTQKKKTKKKTKINAQQQLPKNKIK